MVVLNRNNRMVEKKGKRTKLKKQKPEKTKNKSLGVQEILKNIDTSFIENRIKKITIEDLKKAQAHSADIAKLIINNSDLQKYLIDLKALQSLINDYWNREYYEIPYYTIAATVFTLLYIYNPLDLIPDMIPGIGFIDDALVVALVLQLISMDLKNYKKWQSRRKNSKKLAK